MPSGIRLLLVQILGTLWHSSSLKTKNQLPKELCFFPHCYGYPEVIGTSCYRKFLNLCQDLQERNQEVSTRTLQHRQCRRWCVVFLEVCQTIDSNYFNYASPMTGQLAIEFTWSPPKFTLERFCKRFRPSFFPTQHCRCFVGCWVCLPRKVKHQSFGEIELTYCFETEVRVHVGHSKGR